jgi:DNA invertase Pin-like site-specific DNA recombinase
LREGAVRVNKAPTRPTRGGAVPLTARQAELLQLSAQGLSSRQIARHLGISVRTVEGHFSDMRQRTGTRSHSELIAYAATAGLLQPGSSRVPESADCGTARGLPRSRGMTRPANQSRNDVPPRRLRDGIRDDGPVSAPAYDNSVRIGYARVPARAQDHQAQMEALAAAGCREIITETASTRDGRPELRRVLGMLRPGDTLVIYKPDRIARSVRELLVLLEDELHTRGINLHILSGICAGLHRPNGATIADKMLFMVAAMAAEMECDLIRERTLDGLRAAQAHGRRGGRPRAATEDVLDIARARRQRGEPVTAIARHLGIGRSTLYRALQNLEDGAVSRGAAGQRGLRGRLPRP